MKRLFSVWAISALTLFLSAFHLNAQSVVEQAHEAFAREDFEEALTLYQHAVDSIPSSPVLWYDLGNAYYRCGKPGKAILCYERALRLDPSLKDARENLDFVNSRIIDRPGERGTFLGNAFDSFALMMTPDGWAWAAFILFLMTALAIALYYFSMSIPLRKTGFFGGGALLLLSICCLITAFRANAIASDNRQAIIIAPSSILSTAPHAPANRSQEAMLLHEGTRVVILDSVVSATDSIGSRVWYDVEVDNAHRAWISSDDVEKIRP